MAHISTRQFACARGMFCFGTAGNGGYLYAVEVKSGEVIFKFKTSGAEYFAWINGQILLINRKINQF
ncbi:hypothetical protein [Campylobacter concisus]|uniref:hypothetical protein n=1 Tax=Campylobacter concisus TaxID=199 RepID=UPI00112F9F11|nr:hypothetical protein [Campylobacter concisus]